VSTNYKGACREELERLVDREDHLDAALLCSVDGLPVAYAATMDVEPDALSAMSSSMLSLGDALAMQGGDEICSQVITQSAGRTVALIHAGPDMLLLLMGSKQLKLGMLLTHARKEVEKIVQIIEDSKKQKAAQPKQAAQPARLEDLINKVIQEAEEARRKQ